MYAGSMELLMSMFVRRLAVFAVAVLAVVPATAGAVGGPSPGAVSAQTVKLPASPGSVRGLAENATVSGYTGQVQYQVPVELPAGPGGLSPSLSLGYDGSLGNGPLGVGWALSQAGIRRSLRLGVPSYDARDELELIGIGGGGQLVALAGGEYRVEGFANGYTGRAVDGGFELVDPDGRVRRFGTTAAGRKASGGNGSEDLVWSSPAGMWILDFAGATSAGMLTAIDNGMGQRQLFQYQASAQLAFDASDAGAPWTATMPVSIPVSIKGRLELASGEPPRSSRLDVRDGIYDRSERRFLGFRESTVIRPDPADGAPPDQIIRRTQRYADGLGMDRALRGQVIYERIADGTGKLFRETIHDAAAVAVAGLPADDARLRRAIVRSTSTLHHEGHATPITTRIDHAYDAEARPIEERSLGRTDLTGDESIHATAETVAPRPGKTLRWEASWNNVLGVPAVLRDAAGIAQQVTYDGLGRIVATARDTAPPHGVDRYHVDGPRPYVEHFTFDGDGDAVVALPSAWTPTSRWRHQVEVLDSAGEPLFSATRIDGDRWLVADYRRRDALGRTIAIADAFEWQGAAAALPGAALPASVPVRTTTYDALDRPVARTLPTGSVDRYIYRAFETTSTTDGLAPVTTRLDGEGRVRRTERTVAGAVESVDATYDAAGHITSMLVAGGAGAPRALHRFTYDTLGRVTFATDPDIGDRYLGYDDGDHLVSHTNGASQTVAYTYDGAGRLAAMSGSDGAQYTYHYDDALDGAAFGNVAGRLAWVDEPTGRVELGDDGSGEPTARAAPSTATPPTSARRSRRRGSRCAPRTTMAWRSRPSTTPPAAP